VRSAGRIATRVPSLELFAQSLVVGDVVAVEATTGTDKIVSVMQAHGIRVVVANTRKLRSITEAKARPTGSTHGRWLGCWYPACSMRSGRRTSGRGRCGA